MKILIVDDNEVAQDTLEMALRQEGHEVLSAANGREALDVLRASQVRMVITDWEMPEMDGLDLCRAIRAEEHHGYVYIIIVTCHDTTEETIEGISAGADDFIAKPFHPGELGARVRAGQRVLALETRDLAIFSMAKLAESRDPETGAHLERVRSYCRILVERLAEQNKLGRPQGVDYARMIYLTSPLHDIGKLGVPDCVLLKPGRLSDREFDIMKTHTTVGAETLDGALREFPDASFLRMARDIAATHHERFDGTGYPAGLVEEDIPLCGRIAALADVYDALTTKRVYKNAFGHEVSKSIIVEESGSHFDPDIVAAFLDAEDRFIQVAEHFGEPVAVTV
jgi:putative two-component system response regulator